MLRDNRYPVSDGIRRYTRYQVSGFLVYGKSGIRTVYVYLAVSIYLPAVVVAEAAPGVQEVSGVNVAAAAAEGAMVVLVEAASVEVAMVALAGGRAAVAALKAGEGKETAAAVGVVPVPCVTCRRGTVYRVLCVLQGRLCQPCAGSLIAHW